MSGEKATSPCNKFQANIFNKSKCQNCFKSRELHLLNDRDMEQAKPIYGGWLCLAPEGTDFDNPMQRSRKWQRRFFVLYEHGSLSFALDELPSTLPQGTLNMNLCTDIADAEPRTGQRNALCLVTPEQEIFIRGDNKEITNGWSEQLSAYLRINKQNLKKKRKVEPVATQEPSPAKMAATDPSLSFLESSPVSSHCQEDQLSRRPDVTSVWTVADPPGREQTPAGKSSAYLPSVSKEPLTLNGGSSFSDSVLDLPVDESSGSNNHLAELNTMHTTANEQDQHMSIGSTAEAILASEVKEAASRKGRSEARTSKREKLQSCGDIAQLSVPHPHRRAKSLDGRTSDNVMTPDLLNFKKGWMVKLDENDQWKKYWFVLSTDSLRYYKDSVAEEASHVEGEIDLTMCYNVSEYQVQRNYGFQIHTSKAVFTLSAMTAGIRRNWIQALMKNVHPANAPDVASLPGQHVPCSTPEALPKPDVTRDSPSTDVPAEREPQWKPRSVTDRRREGRYKTFDWADFRPLTQSTLETDAQRTKPPCSLELGDLERRKRREERRRRYENMLGFSLSWEEKTTVGSGVRALSPTSQQKVEEEIEACWRQVENTVFRMERAVPLYTDTKDNAEVEKLLDSYRKWVEELKAKLVESEHRVLELEAQQQQDPSIVVQADICPWDANEQSLNSQTLSLKDVCEETSELLQQQNLIEQDTDFPSPSLTPQTPSIWLHDTEGDFQDLGHLLPNSIAPLLLSPSSDNQDLLSPADGQAVELNLDVAKSACKNQQDKEESDLILTSEAQMSNNGYSSSSVILHPDQALVRRLSQEVELLTNQNQALNQRNQEMLNQLTEADREIERLKAELSSRYADCTHHLPEVEQQGTLRVEHLERELSLRNQELLEAQTLIVSLEEGLRETEALLQMHIPAATEVKAEAKSDCATKAEEYLLLCFETTEAKLTELERQLDQSERTCRELQVQNSELKEAEKLCCQRAADVDADISKLNHGLEEQRTGRGNKRVSAEQRIQQVIGGMVVRLEALRKLLEVIGKFDFEKEHDEEPTVVSQVKWEKVFWRILLSELQASPPRSYEEKSVETLLSEVTEHVILEKQVLLLGHGLLHDSYGEPKSEAIKDLDIIRSNAGFTGTEMKRPDESEIPELNHQVWDTEHFRAATQMKISLLNHITSSVETTAPEKLQLMADRLYDFYFSDDPWSGFIHSAATEALYCWRLSRLHSKYERERDDAKHRLLTLSLSCSGCVKLMEENRELEARIQASLCDNKRDTCCQTEDTCRWDIDAERANEGVSDEIGEASAQQTFETAENCMEVLLPDDEGHLGIQEIPDENTQRSDDIHRETDPSQEMDQVSVLRRRVEELEELLSVIPEEMKDDFDERMRSVQTQHGREVEKLKATCQHGLASMQESHLKVVAELQRRHQVEVERLLMERDQLLEEESAATATAIEAIKNAHRLELERELQKRCQSENRSGNLQDIYRQHGEEVASYQRELDVLSQQFSLKCLENGHLVQALDAERKGLCQCQQENQDLRTRNQELSSHLAAEITRLCSLSKQDDLPLSQGMDVYEMEVTLRVRESEVQCLKQVIASLKEELQSAQRDKRNATKKYKDVYTELSINRAKSEREMAELRENLRLAHQALGRTSP